MQISWLQCLRIFHHPSKKKKKKIVNFVLLIIMIVFECFLCLWKFSQMVWTWLNIINVLIKKKHSYYIEHIDIFNMSNKWFIQSKKCAQIINKLIRGLTKYCICFVLLFPHPPQYTVVLISHSIFKLINYNHIKNVLWTSITKSLNKKFFLKVLPYNTQERVKLYIFRS